MKKNQNLVEFILFSVFSFVGIAFIIGGFIWYSVVSSREVNWVKTEAEIIYIGKSHDYGSEQKHVVEVEFKVRDKVYEASLSEWNSGMRIGNKITIFYNPENPNEIMGTGVSLGYMIFIGVGSLFVIIGMIPMIVMFTKKQKRKRLLECGKRVEATIDDVSFKMNYSVNGRHPYVLECSYVDPISGALYFFKSDSIWYPIGVLLEKQNIKTVPVYVDMTNPKKYYVEIEFFNQYIGN